MYVVETVGDDIDASIAALPAELLDDFAELRAALEVSPLDHRPTAGAVDSRRPARHHHRPGWPGQVVFHVLERDRVVPIVQVSF